MERKRQIITMLSCTRFERYLTACSGDIDKALQLYRKNQIISERMYVPIQNLEIGLRNSLNQVLSAVWGELWFDDSSEMLSSWHEKKIQEAKDELISKGKPIEQGYIVAELTLSFWAGMFSGHYEHILWNKGLLTSVFPFAPSTVVTKDIKQKLDQIRLFRNRVYHHEPVFRRVHAIEIHDHILKFLEWINPEYKKWNDLHDGFKPIRSAL